MSIPQTVPFNFDEVYSFVSQKFIEKGYDVQEGSNTMQLVTAMSYLTSMLNVNTAVNINETLLPLATKRDMVLLGARNLGYEIEHKKSYRYNLTLQFTNDTDQDIVESIQKYTSFSSNYTYYYLGDRIDLTVPANSTETIVIEVKEGELKKYSDETSLNNIISTSVVNDSVVTDYYIDIPFTNVEENGIDAYLTYYDENSVFHKDELWEKADKFIIESNVILNRQYIRLDNIEMKTPRIYFKLGGVGQELRIGTIVNINVLITNGSKGIITELPKSNDLNAEVISYSLLLTGTEEETSDSIKRNAILFNNAANRIITKPDYEAFCDRQALVKFSNVWDGNDEFPKVIGNIWFSFVPEITIRSFSNNSIFTVWELDNKSNYDNWYLDRYNTSNNNIQSIYEQIRKYCVPTLEFNHRNPTYVDFDYTINVVRYNSSKSVSEINNNIFNVINSYFISENPLNGAEHFEYEYFQSSLNKRIDTELTDITGFNITLTTSIFLNDYNVNIEKGFNYKEIIFHLGPPFEKYNVNGVINTSLLPNINTTIGVNELYVDFDNFVYENSDQTIVYSIMMNSSGVITHIGYYKVNIIFKSNIEVIMFIKDDLGYSTGLDIDEVENGIVLNLAYPSPNIKFVKNTLPRLSKVTFL